MRTLDAGLRDVRHFGLGKSYMNKQDFMGSKSSTGSFAVAKLPQKCSRHAI